MPMDAWHHTLTAALQEKSDNQQPAASTDKFQRRPTSISSVNRSSGTRREPCTAMAATLIPIAVNNTVPTLHATQCFQFQERESTHAIFNMIGILQKGGVDSVPRISASSEH